MASASQEAEFFGVGGDDRAEPGAGVLVIAGRDGGRRVLAQLLDALALQLRADLRRLLAQRVGQPHDVARQVVARVGLDLGGGERDAGGEQQGEREEAAKDLEHVSTLVGGLGPRRSRRTVKETGDGVLTGQPMLAWRRDAKGAGMTKCRFWPAGLFALTAAGAAPAFAAPPSPPAPATAAADAKLEAQKAAFLAMPEADRKAVQDALGWLDFYNGAVDGAFGKRTRDSIVAYQQSVSAAPDGIVSPAELEALKTAAQRARAAVDFALVDDRISGVRIGAPLKLLTKLKPSSGDTTLQSGDGSVSLALQARAGAGDDAGLAALYAQLTAEAGGRKITYKAIKAGGVFRRRRRGQGREVLYPLRQVPGRLAGRAGAARLHVRLSNGKIERFRQAGARRGEFLRSVRRYAGEPRRGAHADRFGALAARRRPRRHRRAGDWRPDHRPLARRAADADPAFRPDARAGRPASAELRATALFVAPGQALTALPVVACADLTVDGKPAKILRADAPSGLMLIGGEFGAGARRRRSSAARPTSSR